MNVRLVQIITDNGYLYALDEEGRLWRAHEPDDGMLEWERLNVPEVGQR